MSLVSPQLIAFIEVARVQSFSRASENLGLSQSALSQRIANLERELEHALFVRGRSVLGLTEAGKRLLDYCRCIKPLADELQSELAGQEALSGHLRLGAYSSVARSMVMPALREIGEQVHMSIRIADTDSLVEMLGTGDCDFVFLDYEHERAGIESQVVATEEYVLVHGPKGPQQRMIDVDSGDNLTKRFFRLQGKRKMPPRSFVTDIYGIVDAVAAGWGSAVLPRHLLRGRKGLTVDAQAKTMSMPVVLHYRLQPYYTRLHQLALKTLADMAS